MYRIFRCVTPIPYLDRRVVGPSFRYFEGPGRYLARAGNGLEVSLIWPIEKASLAYCQGHWPSFLAYCRGQLGEMYRIFRCVTTIPYLYRLVVGPSLEDPRYFEGPGRYLARFGNGLEVSLIWPIEKASLAYYQGHWPSFLAYCVGQLGEMYRSFRCVTAIPYLYRLVVGPSLEDPRYFEGPGRYLARPGNGLEVSLIWPIEKASLAYCLALATGHFLAYCVGQLGEMYRSFRCVTTIPYLYRLVVGPSLEDPRYFEGPGRYLARPGNGLEVSLIWPIAKAIRLGYWPFFGLLRRPAWRNVQNFQVCYDHSI